MNPENKKKIRFLIVDDDPICQDVIRLHFSSVGIESTLSNNGIEAISAIKEGIKNNTFFDIIFMDTEMPIMNGLIAAEKIKEFISKENIPFIWIVGITGNPIPENDQSQISKENKTFDFYLRKPVTKNQLFDIVNIIFPKLIISS